MAQPYGYRGRPRTCLWCGRRLRPRWRWKPGEWWDRWVQLRWKLKDHEPTSREGKDLRRAIRQIEDEGRTLAGYGVVGDMEKGFCSQGCGLMFAWDMVRLGRQFKPLVDEGNEDSIT